MKRNFASAFVLSIALAVSIAACGGGRPAPKPLRYHFDEADIALVPMNEKSAVAQAQQEYYEAKAYYQQAKAQLAETDTELKVAKNKKQQAKLELKSAKQKKKAAGDSNDMTRVNAAAKEMRSAELDSRAADNRVSYLKAYRSHLKKQLRYTHENMYAKEAKYELAKARIAQGKNIAPKGFKFENFKKQSDDRSERAQKSKAVAEQNKGKIESKRKKLQSLEQEAAKARGESTATITPASGSGAPVPVGSGTTTPAPQGGGDDGDGGGDSGGDGGDGEETEEE